MTRLNLQWLGPAKGLIPLLARVTLALFSPQAHW